MFKVLHLAYQLSIILSTNLESILQRIQNRYENAIIKGKEKRLYFVLYEVIRNAIVETYIPAQENLPASRILSTSLCVSRSTVLKAYDLLLLEGYIIAKRGSGYLVKGLVTKPKKKLINHSYLHAQLSDKGKSFQENTKLINSTDGVTVAFRPGVPPLDIFPISKWKNLNTLYWRQIKYSALTYSASSGNEQLKRNLANYLNLSRGLKCESHQVIIVSGSLQSLYLIGSVLVNQQDKVVMENPTFPNVHSIFKSLQANILGVAVDNNGLKTKQLKKEQFQQAKIIHTTPSCHYPNAKVLSMKRRQEMLHWANINGTYIIENDYEHEVTNYKQSLPTLFSLDQQDRTIYMGTFNRLLHPSIRVGYMVLPPQLVEPVTALMNHSHRFVPPSIQVVLNQFIEKKFLYAHIKTLISTAHERKQIFIDSFRRHFGSSFEFLNEESDSLHLLGRFNEIEQHQSLIDKFAERNILSHSYRKCFVSGIPKEGIIFGYASVKGAQIKRKVEQMAEIWEKM